LLVNILNKYNFKCTFNINSGLFNNNNISCDNQIIFHNRISKEQSKILYSGYEISAHSGNYSLLINKAKEFLDIGVL